VGGGEVTAGFVYEEDGHRYSLNGVTLPGITQTLRLTGFVDESWFTEESRDRGTATHRACWYLAEGELDWATVDPAILPRVEAFARFLEEHKPKLLAAERPLYSAVYRFAGTFDFVFEAPTLGGIIDLEVKTGKAGLAAKLQTAGQKVLIEEQMGLKNVGRYGFELTANGRYRFVPHTAPRNKVMFLNAVAMVHERINEKELAI
jgi:hypothetical protein